MSNKFEQLLDLLVNEEMDKANELFHEIVVEKSREIYENMIAEEAAEEEMDEAAEEADESVEEELEEETTLEIGGDETDDMVSDIGDADAMDGDFGGEMDGDLGAEGEGSEEERITDLEDALEELKAEFEALMAGEENEPEHDDMFGGDEEGEDDGEEADDEEADDEENESMGYTESRQMTREYRETVSDGHGADKKGRAETADNTRSPVSSAKGRPTTSATAHNILGGKAAEAGGKGGQGLVGNAKGEFTDGGTHNVNGVKSGIKTLNKVAAGHGAEKKGAGETGAYTKSPADRAQ